MPSDPERRARGAQKLGEILGQTPDQVDRSLGDVAPQLATYVLETIYGEIYQSETLDSRTRQIVTVAALATLGTAAPQLRTHIDGAMRCGVTREELVDHDAARALCRRGRRHQWRGRLQGGFCSGRQEVNEAGQARICNGGGLDLYLGCRQSFLRVFIQRQWPGEET
jgi:4-carboxymuconolactone decarboxylase